MIHIEKGIDKLVMDSWCFASGLIMPNRSTQVSGHIHKRNENRWINCHKNLLRVTPSSIIILWFSSKLCVCALKLCIQHPIAHLWIILCISFILYFGVHTDNAIHTLNGASNSKWLKGNSYWSMPLKLSSIGLYRVHHMCKNYAINSQLNYFTIKIWD